MKKSLALSGILIALLAVIATGCSNSAPQPGQADTDTFVFIYTDG